MSDANAVFQRVRQETAAMLGYSLEGISPAQSVRLDRAVALRIEIDRLQAAQLEGDPIDIARMTNATEQLEKLLPSTGSDDQPFRIEFVRLNDTELDHLNRLTAKLHGEEIADGEPVPTVDDGPFSGGREQQARELAELRTKCTEQTI
jgi:hypothetical protein